MEKVYTQNPQIDFLALDYLPESEDLQSVEFSGIEQSEQKWVLDTLKAYQRVFRATGNGQTNGPPRPAGNGRR